MTTTKLSSSLLSLIEDHVKKSTDSPSKTPDYVAIGAIPLGGEEQKAKSGNSKKGSVDDLAVLQLKKQDLPPVVNSSAVMQTSTSMGLRSGLGPGKANRAVMVFTKVDSIVADVTGYVGCQTFHSDVTGFTGFSSMAGFFDRYRVKRARMSVNPVIAGAVAGCIISNDVDNTGTTNLAPGNIVSGSASFPLIGEGSGDLGFNQSRLWTVSAFIKPFTVTIEPKDANEKTDILNVSLINGTSVRLGAWLNSTGASTLFYAGNWYVSGLTGGYTSGTQYATIRREYLVEFANRI